MIVGCYELHLYCDRRGPRCPQHQYRKSPAEYTGTDRAEAYRAARADGWLFTRKEPRQVICSVCRRNDGQ